MISFAKSYYYLLNRSSICYFYNTVYFLVVAINIRYIFFCERFFVKEEKYKIKKRTIIRGFVFFILKINKQIIKCVFLNSFVFNRWLPGFTISEYTELLQVNCLAVSMMECCHNNIINAN